MSRSWVSGRVRWGCLLILAGCAAASEGAAQPAKESPGATEPVSKSASSAPLAERPTAPEPLHLGCAWPCYLHTFARIGAGRGLRLNNPYRLQTTLGSSGDSLSTTAPYLDVRVGAVVGDALGLHHGAAVGVAVALQGVPQQVIVPSYQAVYRLTSAHWLRAHLGPAIVVEPDANVGLELGAEGVLLVRAGVGVYLGLAYAQFWGAATDQTSATLVPIVAAHAGLSLQYEVLP